MKYKYYNNEYFQRSAIGKEQNYECTNGHSNQANI